MMVMLESIHLNGNNGLTINEWSLGHICLVFCAPCSHMQMVVFETWPKGR